jgi:SAM-dependent methyltransferase
MTTFSIDELVARAAALRDTAPSEAEALYLQVLELQPGHLAAHNAIERLNSPRRYSAWMGVNCLIDPRDDIFKFVAEHPISANPVREYLADGWRTLSELMLLLEALDRPLLRMGSVLEFAAGFGRFTRHLARALPGRVTVSDVLPGSVEFLREQFGVAGFPSTHDPEKLGLEPKFDLVFVLSLFTHLPPRMWKPWLAALAGGVKPGGLLIISTHSESTAVNQHARLDENGVYFVTSSESPSLDGEVYGTTFTTRRFSEETIATVPGLSILDYRENAFWAGQDAIVIEVGKAS